MHLIGLTILVMIAFAANTVLNRMAVFGAGWSPASVGTIRLASGAAVLIALVVILKGPSALKMKRGALLAGVAALSLYIFGFSIASGRIDAGTGALVLFAMVQITMFGGAVITREKIGAFRWIGTGLAMTGLTVLLLPEAGTARLDPVGFALMAMAGIGWGLYSLNGRRAGDPIVATALNFAFSTPLAALWLLVEGGWGRGESWGVWPALISGGITSSLGYALWYRVVPRIPATVAALSQLSVPMIAALGGLLLLAEVPDLRFWIASALILGGIAFGVYPAKTRK